MGILFSKIFKKKMRIVMLGFDGAGKTTILYNLQFHERVPTVPTVGFNVETIKYQNVLFTVWDIAGQTLMRALWSYYFTGTQGIIFVVDSADRERIKEAHDELHYILNDRKMPRKAILLIIANKQDLPNAMNSHEIQEKLGLPRLRDRRYYVQLACAIKGEGLLEGLSWLGKNCEV